MLVSVVAKRFLNVWNFISLLIGSALLLITLYILIFQSDSYVIPKLGYWAAVVCAGLLILMAALGLYGLRQQRVCITKNQRNYALGTYCFIGFLTGIVLVLAGTIALKFNTIIHDAKYISYTTKAQVYLEHAMIDNLDDLATNDANGWRTMQNNWFCCGYYNMSAIQDNLELKYITMGYNLNAIQGIYCNNTCMGSKIKTTCPQEGAGWCRDVFLHSAQNNNGYVGWVSIAGGIVQLLGFILAIFILLCDIRMLRQATMQPHALELAIKEAQS